MKNKLFSIIGGCLAVFCISTNINAQNLTSSSNSLQNLNNSNNGEVLIGSNNLDQMSVVLYPNPTNGSFTLSFNKNIEIGYVEFHTVDERLMEIKCLNSSSIDFNISDLPAGIYWVKIIAPNFYKQIQVTKI